MLLYTMATITAATTKLGLLSLGEMGAGVAKMLTAHGYSVLTNCQGRSQDTIERARQANAQLVSSDLDLVQQCDLILSVVPPRDAEATAQRVIDALTAGDKTAATARKSDLLFADLNAVSPATSKAIAAMFARSRVPVRFIDGCILGGSPRLKAAPDAGTNVTANTEDGAHGGWSKPRVPISGPHTLSSLPDGEALSSLLNLRHVSSEVGAASGLKMCFAALTKGYTAIATQSFATAHSLGIAGELRREAGLLIPAHLAAAERGVPSMVPKAYRWVREMEEIAATMEEEGGWEKNIFAGAAEVYRSVAGDEVLKQERAGKRTRGTTVEDVAAVMAEGLQKKRKKNE